MNRISRAFDDTVEVYRACGVRHPRRWAVGEWVILIVCVALVVGAIAGCGSVDTPRERFDGGTVCRAVNGGCDER